jgi:hypothetical protein
MNVIYDSGYYEISEAHERTDREEAFDARRPLVYNSFLNAANEKIKIQPNPKSDKKKEKLNVTSNVI